MTDLISTEMQQLFRFLSLLSPLSNEFRQFLSLHLKTEQYHRKELLLREGQICQHAWFLCNGLVRSYYIKDEKDISSWFMSENQIVMVPQSMYEEQPSDISIEALEHCKALRVHYPDIMYAFKHFPEANIIARKMSDQYYMLAERRLQAIRMRKATDRYLFIQEHEPELLNRVPIKHLASYLDLDITSLNKIRARL